MDVVIWSAVAIFVIPCFFCLLSCRESDETVAKHMNGLRARERADRLTYQRMLIDDWQRRFDREVPPPAGNTEALLRAREYKTFMDSMFNYQEGNRIYG